MNTDKKTEGNIREIILNKKSALAEKILEKQIGRSPELKSQYKKIDIQKCHQDIVYHLSYLAEAVALDSEILFLEYTRWLKHLFLGLHIPLSQLADNFEIIKEVLTEEIETGVFLSKIRDFLEKGKAIFIKDESELNSFLNPKNQYYELCVRYMENLLKGNRLIFNSLILEKVQKEGIPVKDIYLNVFEPVQKEIGRLWQLGRISVAQEHYCTAATQSLIAQLYPFFLNPGGDNRYTCITACIGNELHEIGIRMVADFLEMDNWSTYHLGANTPNDSLIKTVLEKQVDLLAVSVTITYHLHQLEKLIIDLRKQVESDKIKIMVGGYPFNIDDQLWRKVGADGTARQGQEAVNKANQLVKNKVGDNA